jgi:hypothetical protein
MTDDILAPFIEMIAVLWRMAFAQDACDLLHPQWQRERAHTASIRLPVEQW